jgi:uncharacterized protein
MQMALFVSVPAPALAAPRRRSTSTTRPPCAIVSAARLRRGPVRATAAAAPGGGGGDNAVGVETVGAGAAARIYEHVGWAAVEAMCEELVAMLAGREYDVILAVTRGGMVPATMLAQALEVRNVLTATVIFYTDEGDTFFGMAEPRFLSFPNPERLEGKRVLVVDDVWDSGRTAVAVRKRVERANAAVCDLCVLHFKENQTVFGDLRPQFFAAETDNWVVYPWERISPHHNGSGARRQHGE